MDITIRVPDDVAAQYKIYAVEGDAVCPTLEAAIVAQLTRFAGCPPTVPYMLFPPSLKTKLETVMQSLPIQSAEDLVRKVAELAGIQVGHVRLGFTPTQLVQLKARAERWGQPVEHYVEGAVRRILEEQLGVTDPRPGEMLKAAAEQPVKPLGKVPAQVPQAKR